MKLKVTGLSEMIATAESMPNKLKRASLRAIYDDAVEVFRESQELVPVDTGDLRASGGVTRPTMTDPSVEIFYDDYKSMIVHENVLGHTFKHGKQDHYLSDPYNKMFNSPSYAADLESKINENMAKNKDIRGLTGRQGSRGPLAKGRDE